MSQFHKAGEKIVVDYSGMTMSIIDPETFEIRSAEIIRRCAWVITIHLC